MQNLRRLLRMPLVKIFTGEQIGEVQDVVLDINHAVVCGIKLFANNSGIAFSNLIIGRDAILVHTSNDILNFDECFSETLLSADLYDKQLYTDTGVIMGILVDILYDSSTGELKNYEISDSFLGDLIDGRKFMPFPPVQVVGQDKIIVPQSMSKLLV